jgi:Glyoxalase/Bleomycin resistance protein/Dioxygenase superfamily
MREARDSVTACPARPINGARRAPFFVGCGILILERTRTGASDGKLRHVSLHTPDPEKTAEFYKRVFDMVEVGRTDDKFAEGIFLSDGTVNLSVVRFKTEQAADRGDGLGSVFGLHHFGFWVENEDETRRRLEGGRCRAQLHRRQTGLL